MILDIAKAAINTVVNGIARILHPEKPREWFENVHLPTDYTAEEVTARLDEAAKANPQFRNWKHSWVDLLKLSHPDDPDAAAAFPVREAVAKALGCEEHFNRVYSGREEENVWCHKQTFKAIQQRGIPMPAAS